MMQKYTSNIHKMSKRRPVIHMRKACVLPDTVWMRPWSHEYTSSTNQGPQIPDSHSNEHNKSTTTNLYATILKKLSLLRQTWWRKIKMICMFVKLTSHLLVFQNTRLSDGRIFENCYGWYGNISINWTPSIDSLISSNCKKCIKCFIKRRSQVEYLLRLSAMASVSNPLTLKAQSQPLKVSRFAARTHNSSCKKTPRGAQLTVKWGSAQRYEINRFQLRLQVVEQLFLAYLDQVHLPFPNPFSRVCASDDLNGEKKWGWSKHHYFPEMSLSNWITDLNRGVSKSL